MFLCSLAKRYSSIKVVIRYTVRVPKEAPKNTAQKVLFMISNIVLLRYIINYILYYRPRRGLLYIILISIIHIDITYLGRQS